MCSAHVAEHTSLKDHILDAVLDLDDMLGAVDDPADDQNWRRTKAEIKRVALMLHRGRSGEQPTRDVYWRAFLLAMRGCSSWRLFLDGQVFVPVLADLLQRRIVIHSIQEKRDHHHRVIGHQHHSYSLPENADAWGINAAHRPIEVAYYARESASHYLCVTKRSPAAADGRSATHSRTCRHLLSERAVYNDAENSNDESAAKASGSSTTTTSEEFTTVTRRGRGGKTTRGARKATAARHRTISGGTPVLSSAFMANLRALLEQHSDDDDDDNDDNDAEDSTVSGDNAPRRGKQTRTPTTARQTSNKQTRGGTSLSMPPPSRSSNNANKDDDDDDDDDDTPIAQLAERRTTNRKQLLPSILGV